MWFGKSDIVDQQNMEAFKVAMQVIMMNIISGPIQKGVQKWAWLW